jgi:hypothetical protein
MFATACPDEYREGVNGFEFKTPGKLHILRVQTQNQQPLVSAIAQMRSSVDLCLGTGESGLKSILSTTKYS